MLRGVATAAVACAGCAACIWLWVCLQEYAWRKVRACRGESRRVAVVLGSGGHTTEMLALVRALPSEEFSPRTYYVSSGDAYSVGKAAEFEADRYESSNFQTVELPRARAVGQSWLTTPLSVLLSLLFCIWHIAVRPLVEPGPEPFADVVLMNGPGTCVTICMAVWTLRLLALPAPKLIFVESFARVRSLSLSGKLLRNVVDVFLVQWPTTHHGAVYRGLLV